MSAVPDITLLRPPVLLALLAVAAVAYLRHRDARSGAWQRVATPALMQAMTALGWVTGQGGRPRFWLAIGAAALISLALTGPAVERRDAVSFRNLDGVIVVLDASPSVTQAPRWPQMQTMSHVIVAALGTRPAAAVVFAGDAYLVSGLTLDHRELGQTLALIDADTVPDLGSRPERGLHMAAQIVAESALLSGDVLLLSDGAGLGPEALSLVESLAARQVRVSVVALDTPSAALTALARRGGGEVFTLDQTNALTAWIRDGGRTQVVRQSYPLLYWRDLGRGVLGLALVPVLLLFRRARL